MEHFLFLLRVLNRCSFRDRSEEHTSELQSLRHLVCRLLLEKKKQNRHVVLRQAVLHALIQFQRRCRLSRRLLLHNSPCQPCACSMAAFSFFFFFFLNDPAPPEISPFPPPAPLRI